MYEDSSLSEDSGKESFRSDSESDSSVDPEEAGPSKTNRRALFYCEVCDIDCNSVEGLQTHFAGIKHQKKLCLKGLSSNLKDKYEVEYTDELSGKVIECTLCGLMFHALERGVHFKSENHRALCNLTTEKSDNSKWIKVIGDAPPDPPGDEVVDVDEPEIVSDGLHCKLCSVTLLTRALYKAHVEGKRHQKKARWHYICKEGDVSEVNQYWCRLCNLFCADADALTTHYLGRIHVKTVWTKVIKHQESGLIADNVKGRASQKSTSRRDKSKGVHSNLEATAKREWVEKQLAKLEKIQADAERVKKEREEKKRMKREPVRIKTEPVDEEMDVERPVPKQETGKATFHSSRNSKQRSYRSSLNDSPSPPPPNLKKERSRSPLERRTSHQSTRRESYSSSKNRRSRSRSRSRSLSRSRRSTQKDSGYRGGGRDSSTKRRRSARYSSDSDSSTAQNSSVSRGCSKHTSHESQHRRHSSSSSYTRSSSSRGHRQENGRRSSHYRSRSRSRERRDSRSYFLPRSQNRGRDRGRSSYQERSRGRRRHSDRWYRVEAQSGDEAVQELNFHGFSGNPESDDEGAPPNTSLSVSYILNAMRKVSETNNRNCN